MIIFYDKTTGNIIGNIDGRVHDQQHLTMWIGDKNTTDRIVVQWKPVKWYNREGKEVTQESPEVFTADYEPDCQQKELFFELDKNSSTIYQYKVDLRTKLLVKK